MYVQKSNDALALSRRRFHVEPGAREKAVSEFFFFFKILITLLIYCTKHSVFINCFGIPLLFRSCFVWVYRLDLSDTYGYQIRFKKFMGCGFYYELLSFGQIFHFFAVDVSYVDESTFSWFKIGK